MKSNSDNVDTQAQPDAAIDQKVAAHREQRLARLAAAKVRARTAGDPLRLSPENKPKPHEVQAKQRAEKQEKARRFVTVRVGGVLRPFDLRGNPLMAMLSKKQITNTQFAAAQLFREDYEVAGFAHLRSPDVTPRVDSSHTPQLNEIAIDAQRNLVGLKKSMRNNEGYDIMVAVAGHGTSLTEIHEAGGELKAVLSSLLKRALDQAATFYLLQEEEPLTRSQIALQRIQANAARRVHEKIFLERLNSPGLDQAITEHKKVKIGRAGG